MKFLTSLIILTLVFSYVLLIHFGMSGIWVIDEKPEDIGYLAVFVGIGFLMVLYFMMIRVFRLVLRLPFFLSIFSIIPILIIHYLMADFDMASILYVYLYMTSIVGIVGCVLILFTFGKKYYKEI
jgi:hypothetical protein